MVHHERKVYCINGVIKIFKSNVIHSAQYLILLNRFGRETQRVIKHLG